MAYDSFPLIFRAYQLVPVTDFAVYYLLSMSVDTPQLEEGNSEFSDESTEFVEGSDDLSAETTELVEQGDSQAEWTRIARLSLGAAIWEVL